MNAFTQAFLRQWVLDAMSWYWTAWVYGGQVVPWCLAALKTCRTETAPLFQAWLLEACATDRSGTGDSVSTVSGDSRSDESDQCSGTGTDLASVEFCGSCPGTGSSSGDGMFRSDRADLCSGTEIGLFSGSCGGCSGTESCTGPQACLGEIRGDRVSAPIRMDDVSACVRQAFRARKQEEVFPAAETGISDTACNTTVMGADRAPG